VNRLLRALMLLVVMGSLVVAGISYALLAEIRRPVDPQITEPIEFEILPGQSASEVGQSLKDMNLIRQPLLFNLMLRQREAADQLQAGTYQLSPAMTMGEIISTLQEAPSTDETQITVIEGMRLEEVAQVVVDAGLAETTEAFLEVAKDPEPFRANHERLRDIPAGQSLEGYLFPDTYRLETTAAISEVIETMLDRFDEQYASFETEVIVQDRTIHEIVTMASIVQREAANDDEMPHIAWVFWNRLKPEYANEVNGRLQADPTVQYAAGYDEAEGTWWRKNIDQFLEIEHPYNTRINQGLPPGPIANPGLQALRSAARPGPQRPDSSDGTNDLYFVAKCGESAHNFAATLDEFSRYEAEFLNCTTNEQDGG
jgi:UPF0755 protein